MSTSPGCDLGLGRRVRGEAPVRPADGEHQAAGPVVDLGGPQRPAGQRRVLPDLQLLQPEFQRAVVHHHVDEVDHVGLGHERGHAVAPETLGIDHPVGAHPQQLRLRRLAPGPGDHVDRGVEGAAGHRHEQVVGVGVEGGDERARPLDPRPQQGVVVGHVADDGRVLHGGDPVQVPVDDHDLLAGVAQVAGDLAADPAPTADHHVARHRADVPVHPAPPDQFPHVPVDEQFQCHREGVERRAHTQQDEHDGEHLDARRRSGAGSRSRRSRR